MADIGKRTMASRDLVRSELSVVVNRIQRKQRRLRVPDVTGHDRVRAFASSPVNRRGYSARRSLRHVIPAVSDSIRSLTTGAWKCCASLMP